MSKIYVDHFTGDVQNCAECPAYEEKTVRDYLLGDIWSQKCWNLHGHRLQSDFDAKSGIHSQCPLGDI
jgi:hypothetical protein